MELTTPWSAALGLALPIVNAPMGGTAGGELAAAVSRAGGLGMIGMGSSATAETLEHELQQAKDARIGVGLVHWVTQEDPRLLDLAIAAKPKLLSVSFGDEWSWVRRAHDAGLTVATQVADVGAARQAVAEGVDVLVARGAEAGGHGEPAVGTLPLLTQLLDELDVPILAAGGSGSARGIAAVLAAGASAAWLGTIFTTCTEALTPEAAREALLAADGTDTVTTTAFDEALRYRWPSTIPERVLRNDFVDRWDGRPVDDTAREQLMAAIKEGDAPVNAGQGVGMVTESVPAAELMRRLHAETVALLRRWAD